MTLYPSLVDGAIMVRYGECAGDVEWAGDGRFVLERPDGAFGHSFDWWLDKAMKNEAVEWMSHSV